MTSSSVPAGELPALIAAERRELADVLAGLPAEAWDRPTLCAGWRVREVVAHITMPFRYSTARFAMELIRSGGRFHRMADRCAWRDATAGPDELTAALRDNAAHPWKPPGAGLDAALTHDVIHGLDVTTPLGAGLRLPRPRCGPSWPPSRDRPAGSTSESTWTGSNCTPRTSTGPTAQDHR
jgi:uncharacterized protein (TIGR03083 family)